MGARFVFLGAAHLLMLASVPALALALSRLSRGRPQLLRAMRYLLAGSLASTAVAWYAYVAAHTGIRFPDTLPLDLCDVTLWVAVVAALTVNRTAVEFAYFAGVGGSSMALLTPDLWVPTWSWPTIAFFVLHGLVVATPLVLIWSGASRPRAGSVVRVLLLLNAYAGAVAVFNLWFGTNYMYLCRKPGSPSLLDYFGPWPVYIAAAECFAVLLFWALWLPFRRVQVRT
jgi:hypothetical integral membrane protein (TIGR02206 family)